MPRHGSPHPKRARHGVIASLRGKPKRAHAGTHPGGIPGGQTGVEHALQNINFQELLASGSVTQEELSFVQWLQVNQDREAGGLPSISFEDFQGQQQGAGGSLEDIIAALAAGGGGGGAAPRTQFPEEAALLTAQANLTDQQAAMAQLQSELLPQQFELEQMLAELQVAIQEGTLEVAQGQLVLGEGELALANRTQTENHFLNTLMTAGTLKINQGRLEFDRERFAEQLAFDRERLAQEGQLQGRQLDLFAREMEQKFGLDLGALNLAKQRLKLDTELGRGQLALQREQFGESQAAAQAERAANPRRIFESLAFQSRRDPTATTRALQDISSGTLAGQNELQSFKHGGTVEDVRDLRGTDDLTNEEQELLVRLTNAAVGSGGVGALRANRGKHVEGPTLLLVGEGKNNEGIKRGTAEVVAAPPGTVVAPVPKGLDPTNKQAADLIMNQLRDGGQVTGKKAKKILRHGSVRGEALTPAQERLFGFIAGGGTPTRAQEGISLGAPPITNISQIRERRPISVLPGPTPIRGPTPITPGIRTTPDTAPTFTTNPIAALRARSEGLAIPASTALPAASTPEGVPITEEQAPPPPRPPFFEQLLGQAASGNLTATDAKLYDQDFPELAALIIKFTGGSINLNQFQKEMNRMFGVPEETGEAPGLDVSDPVELRGPSTVSAESNRVRTEIEGFIIKNGIEFDTPEEREAFFREMAAPAGNGQRVIDVRVQQDEDRRAFEQVRDRGAQEILAGFRGSVSSLRGTGGFQEFDPLRGTGLEGTILNNFLLRDVERLSGTQQGALDSLLSGFGVPGGLNDFVAALRQNTIGGAAVRGGRTARFAGAIR